MTGRSLSLVARTAVAFAATLSAVAASGCSSSEAARGTLIVTFDSDMAMPRQIDSIRVQVLSRGVPRLDVPYAVGSRDQRLPTTLTLIAGSDATTPVTVRVAGIKQTKALTLREAITTVPVGRSAELRMPVQWLCTETVKSTPGRSGFDLPDLSSVCTDGNTCRAGRCVPSDVDSDDLPDYAPQNVWGGAELPEDGTCFDTLPCMLRGEAFQPSADCSLPKPHGDRINVALRVTEGGICDSTNTTCFVPLNAEDGEGWRTQSDGETIRLAPGVCDKLADHSVGAVYLSTQCPSKTSAIPVCGEWSAVPRNKAITTDAANTVARVELVTSLLPNSSTARPCCSLMANDELLYTCLCDSEPTAQGALTPNANLVEIDLGEPDAAQPVAALALSATRTQLGFPTATFDGALWVAADRTLIKRPLRGTGGMPKAFMVRGSVYESTALLADASALFMLASDVRMEDGVTPVAGAPVQIIKLSKDGAISVFDTGGNSPVFQFAQDAGSLYVGVDKDAASGGGFARVSSIVRINKQNGSLTPIAPPQTLHVDDRTHGGYVGVQIAGSVFGLYEDALTPDGMRSVMLHEFAADGSSASALPKTIFQLAIDPDFTTFTLVGAVDGTPILSRIDYDDNADATAKPRSGSVIIVSPSTKQARAIADFAGDYAIAGLVEDSDAVYWMNNSGKVWSFPKAGLQ